MAKTITASGEYTRKQDGSKVSYDFEYQVFDNLDDAIASLGEDKALRDLQRITKVDANNVAREKAKVLNGDSERKVMSEEEKAEAKARRAENKRIVELARTNPEIAEILKAKGISI